MPWTPLAHDGHIVDVQRFKKWAVRLVALVALVILGVAIYVTIQWDHRYDDVAGPDLAISADPELIARGEYLVWGPAHCSNCHVASFEEMERSDKGERLALRGGVVFPMDPLGAISIPNLTPDVETGIGRYDDRKLFRMLRHAVRPDGRASIAPMMPFANMADDDLVAIVSYLRTMEPVRNEVSDREFTIIGKLVRTFAPAFQPVLDANPAATAPPMAATKERGEYLARYVANCKACHTKHDPATLEFIGPEFAGGAEFEPMPGPKSDPTLWTRAPNLTPAPGSQLTVIGSKEAWIQRFRMGRTLIESPMHWGPFSRMSDEDLEALWLFFNSLDPVENEIGPTSFKKEE